MGAKENDPASRDRPPPAIAPQVKKESAMSLPYPNDRARARQDQGEQPYKDAREALGQTSSELQARAEEFGEEHLRESDEERAERLRVEANERLRAVSTSNE